MEARSCLVRCDRLFIGGGAGSGAIVFEFGSPFIAIRYRQSND